LCIYHSDFYINDLIKYMQNLSLKKIFKFWLPTLFIISVIISVIYIFTVKDVQYLSSTFSVGLGNFFLDIFSIFLSAIDVSSGLIVTVFLCALVHFLLADLLLVIRLLKLKKLEQSGAGKAFIRFLGTQLIGGVIFLVSFILIFAVSFGIAFAFGYGDMTLHKKDALVGVISDNQEIIKNIQSHSSIIDVYDASGEFGVVLARRNLKKEDKLTAYNGTILPLLVKFVGKDNDGRTFYISDTNSVVYTNFTKDKSDQIIIELAFNHLRHNKNPLVASIFKSSKAPTVSYLDDEEYAPFVKRKQAEINAGILKDFQDLVSSNEKIVAECKANDANNINLIAEQESDYQKNCVASENYSDCAELKQKINENKGISQEATSVCQENKGVLASQDKELVDLKADIEQQSSDVLEEQKGELSNGIYFPDIQNVYMRVIPNQDAFVYLNTLLHELFHHYSKGGSELPAFLNEGITDFQTLKSFNLSDYEIAGSSGYFKEVQVVFALLERIPEEELMNVYFNNNIVAFEQLFKKYFPEANYETFLSKGDAIFKETYEASEQIPNRGFWDTDIDHPSVQDVRLLLGLEQTKFFK